ncbi:MAG: response regulator, partial [Bacteroidales bacterium]|nr:response regulator [Bacteroidales bacterium]
HIERSIKCYFEKDRITIMEAFQKCVNDGTSYDLEFPFTTAKGKKIWVRTIAKAEKENNKVVRVLGYIMDITERKRAEEKLLNALKAAKESDRMKTVFLANMSHELRTPLNAIIGFSDIVNDGIDVKNNKKYTKIVNDSGKHLLSIVEDLFDVTLIETGEVKFKMDDIELYPILIDVKNVIEADQKKLDKTDIILKLEIPADGKNVVVKSDASKLKQILINLLKNALKFTHEGHIKFGFKIDSDIGKPTITFFVEDTGIGIPIDKREYIFNVFKQVEETNTRNYGGTGLGLTISKKLVELLGGHIWLESEEGKGTIFYFTIPCCVDKKNGETNKVIGVQKSEANIENTNKIVLVVEDVEISYLFLKTVLENLGLKTIWAKNGVEAIEHCKENNNINLVLMDIRMPVMSGYQATKEILRFRPKLPIISQTAHAIAGDREKSLAAGCVDYISKPIEKDKLIEILNRQFKTKLPQ